MDLLNGLIPFTAGRAAHVYFSIDSTHRRFNGYTLIDYAKKANAKGQYTGKGDTPKGQRRAADTCEYHALISPNSAVLASIVTYKDTADSAMFENICAKIPERSGPVPGDGAHCSSNNCKADMAKGRDLYLGPKKNHTGKGAGNRAKTVRLRWGHRAGSTKST